MISDFTIISTGLLNNADFSTLSYYESVCPVIIQSWDGQNFSTIPKTFSGHLNISSLPPIPKEISAPFMHRYSYMFLGIKIAVERVETQYTIRLRNDEHISDLSFLIEEFLKDIKKIVCSNIFWPKEYPNHIGDHIFIAETDLLQKTYITLCEAIYHHGQPVFSSNPSPEHALFDAFIVHSRNKYSIRTDRKETISDRAAVVSIDKLGAYKIVNNTDEGRKEWNNFNLCPYQLIVKNEELKDQDILTYREIESLS